jgi:hypothetical protein
MKITHYICPRACGKTTFAEKLQKEDPSLLLIKRDISLTDWDLLLEKFRGRDDFRDCYTGVIIDEFLTLTNLRSYDRDKVISMFNKMGMKEMILISTPVKLYDKYSETDQKEMNSKFLLSSTRDKIAVIKTNFGRNWPEEQKQAYKDILGVEQYKTEVLGVYLEESKHVIPFYINNI